MTEDERLFSFVDTCLYQAKQVLDAGFWRNDEAWVRHGGFLVVITNLSDVLMTLHRLKRRISITEDVGHHEDVTHLIKEVRNAACHMGSPLRRATDNASISFATIVGRGTLMCVGDLNIENPYEDDVAFYYGRLRVFLFRHLIRAWQLSAEELADFRPNGYWLSVR